MFEELLHLSTLSQVHNGPQVYPTTSGFPLNNNNNNKLIDKTGSLCSSDSVEEENEIEEQSGQPLKRQIPQSQRGKVLVENNSSIVSFPFRFFIQLSSQTAHMFCDFPLVYRKLH